MIPKISIAVCLVAWIATLVIGFFGIGWNVQNLADVILLAHVFFPYAILLCLVGFSRRRKAVSVGLLVLSIGVSAIGLWGFASSCIQQQASTEQLDSGGSGAGQVADVTLQVVPMVQSFVCVCAAILVIVVSVMQSPRKPSTK